MQALRQFYTVQGNTVLVRLPDNFPAKQIEVIILPSEDPETKQISADEYFEMTSDLTWQERRTSAPPPLPVWSAEERQEFLSLLRNGPTLSAEEIRTWENAIEEVRTWTVPGSEVKTRATAAFSHSSAVGRERPDVSLIQQQP